MTTQDTAGVRHTDAASEAAHARPECPAAHYPDWDAAHHRATGEGMRITDPVRAETIVYLSVRYVNAQRAGMHEDVDNYLDNHHGAHKVTAQYECDHLWIAPLYIQAQEIRVPRCAVWEVGE